MIDRGTTQVELTGSVLVPWISDRHESNDTPTTRGFAVSHLGSRCAVSIRRDGNGNIEFRWLL